MILDLRHYLATARMDGYGWDDSQHFISTQHPGIRETSISGFDLAQIEQRELDTWMYNDPFDKKGYIFLPSEPVMGS